MTRPDTEELSILPDSSQSYGAATTPRRPKKRELLAMLVFAFLGNASCQATGAFPRAFYIEFLAEKRLNKIAGTICISMTMITQAASPYLFKCLPDYIKKISLIKRYIVLCVSNSIFIALMGSLDSVLEWYPKGELALGIIFILRSLQGLAVGILFVIVQGEVVDIYLKENKVLIVIISSAMFMSNILCSILVAFLYTTGGWALVGPGIAALSLLPLLLIPAIKSIQGLEKDNDDYHTAPTEDEDVVDSSSKDKMTKLRKFTYYQPDLAVFLNNVIYNALFYVLPARMVKFTGRDLNTAALFMDLINVFSFISALILGYVAEKLLDAFSIMLMGNAVFYVGCVIVFGSTTEFLHFTSDFEVGSVLMGLGDAAIMNLAIMSKYVMFDRWGLTTKGLGSRSTAVNNLVYNLSSPLGIILSGYTDSRGSEVPALGTIGGVFVIVTIGLLFCKQVN